MTIQDRWYQTEAVNSVFDYFGSNKGNPAVGLPTAAGKGVVIGRLIERALMQYPFTRIIVATHVKELVQQNYKALKRIWPDAPAGRCSTGLGEHDVASAIIFGGVKTLLNRVELLGSRDLLLIDEVHLLSPDQDSEYQQLIRALKSVNPYLKVIGFSATLFRAKIGDITNGGIITDICYNMCSIDGFARLIAEGYLAIAIPKKTEDFIDVKDVAIFNGDFAKKQLEAEVDKKVYSSLLEACELGHDRHSWLVFAPGVKSSEHCAEVLNSFGVSAVAVHSKISQKDRDKRIEMHKRGEVKALVGNNIFTTGYDHPPLDLIIDLQPTMSVVKHVQKYGRGTRPYDWLNPQLRIPGFDYTKENCLILDFARNTKRLGPINDPKVPKPREKSGSSQVPVRICDAKLPNGKECGVYNHTRATKCMGCGAEFTTDVKIFEGASTDEIISSDIPDCKIFDVITATYNLHNKEGAKPSMKISYICVGQSKAFVEWVGIESPVPYVRERASKWWQQRHWSVMPNTVKDALDMQGELRTPKTIRVWMNKKPYPEILNYGY